MGEGSFASRHKLASASRTQKKNGLAFTFAGAIFTFADYAVRSGERLPVARPVVRSVVRPVSFLRHPGNSGVKLRLHLGGSRCPATEATRGIIR
jgi:hypothetical protein